MHQSKLAVGTFLGDVGILVCVVSRTAVKADLLYTLPLKEKETRRRQLLKCEVGLRTYCEFRFTMPQEHYLQSC